MQQEDCLKRAEIQNYLRELNWDQGDVDRQGARIFNNTADAGSGLWIEDGIAGPRCCGGMPRSRYSLTRAPSEKMMRCRAIVLVVAIACTGGDKKSSDPAPCANVHVGDYTIDNAFGNAGGAEQHGDIGALAGICEITGGLFIRQTALTDLLGLESLATIGGYLWISENEALTSVDGLSGLMSVGVNLSVDNNPALTDLSGLAALRSVGAECKSGQETLCALNISSNDALADISALSALTFVDDLTFRENASLTNLDGLSSLTEVGGLLYIADNNALTDISGLSAVTSVGSISNRDPERAPAGVSVEYNDMLCQSSVDAFVAGVTVAGIMNVCCNDDSC